MGAMMYERHKDKIRKDASWWCQAETVVGCINAWQLTGEQSYLDSAVRTWNFIKSRMIDKEYGEWFRTVLEDGTPRYKDTLKQVCGIVLIITAVWGLRF